MKKIKVGIIGTGLIGPVHLGALRRIHDVEVVAIADDGDERTKEKALSLGIRKWYGDYRILLLDPDIDVVHICVPNHLHAPVVKKALEAGKHVVCEKPLALSYSEAEQLVSIAQQKGLLHAVHFNIRYYPLIRQIRSMISKDDTGKLFLITGSYLQDWLLYDTDYNWRLEKEFSGATRAVADIGSHWLDLVEYVSGRKISAVFADLVTVHPRRKKPLVQQETYNHEVVAETTDVFIDTEDCGSILLRFSSGEHGVLTVSQVSAGHKNCLSFEIAGSKSSVAWCSESPEQIRIGSREGGSVIFPKDPSICYPEASSLMTLPGGHMEGFHDASLALFTEVYQCIRTGIIPDPEDASYPTFLDGLRSTVLNESIFKSSLNQIWIDIE